MSDLVTNVGFVFGRYFHIICTALLIGGTLFYLWVVPVAISDLKDESQLEVFAKARWMFRRIVFSP